MFHTSREGFELFILSLLSSLSYGVMKIIFSDLLFSQKIKITHLFLQFHIRHHPLLVAGVKNHLQHKQPEFLAILKPSSQCLVQWH